MARAVFDLYDRSPIYQRYLQQPQQPQDEAEEEPVHALDLRICKVDETISRFNASDVLGHQNHETSSATSAPVQQQRQTPEEAPIR